MVTIVTRASKGEALTHDEVDANFNNLNTGKEPSLTAGTSAQYYRGDKTWQTLNKAAVGLGSVDNTSDASKPVSTAQQTALDLKANALNAALTGTTSIENLTFSGTGRRITGDFSNATLANRVMFQTSTVNSNTGVSAIPNGTNNTSSFATFNSSDPANASYLQFSVNGTETRVSSSATGTASSLPMLFLMAGTEAMRIDTSRNLSIASGNLTFAGTGQRITGDFTNATIASRTLFQSNTLNGVTNVGFLPNGAANVSSVTLFNSSDTVNNSYAQLRIDGVSAQVRSNANGTGTALPLTLQVGGTDRVTVTTTGRLEAAYGAKVTGPATLSGVELGTMSVESPVWRNYIGDGTGYSWTLSKRASGTTTDLVTVSDVGNLGLKAAGKELRFYNAAGNNWTAVSSPCTAGDTELDFKVVTKSGTLYMDASGNIGSNVTPSAWGGGFKALEFFSSSTITAHPSTPALYLSSNIYYNGTNWIFKTGAKNGALFTADGTNGRFEWAITGASTAGGVASTTTQMMLDGSGNLSIAGSLLVNGTVSMATAAAGGAYNNIVTATDAIYKGSSTSIGVVLAMHNGSAIRLNSGSIQFRAANAVSDSLWLESTGLGIKGSTSIYWDGYAVRKPAFTVSYDGSQDYLEIGSSANLGNTVASYITFKTGPSNAYAERARIDGSGNLLVGVTSGSNHAITKAVAEGSDILYVYSTSTINAAVFQAVSAQSWNAAKAAFSLGKNSTTSRSINAGGTINASGADYAEYMRKSEDCGLIAKGAIVGVNADGELTDKWSEAISFVVKSTDPSYVGGDTWGSEEALGLVRPTDVEAEDYAERLAVFEATLEDARSRVDRIAYAGQVPVNVFSSNVGDYIVPVQDGEGIKGVAIAEDDMTLKQYMKAVGIVQNILPDGRANIRVKVA